MIPKADILCKRLQEALMEQQPGFDSVHPHIFFIKSICGFSILQAPHQESSHLTSQPHSYDNITLTDGYIYMTM